MAYATSAYPVKAYIKGALEAYTWPDGDPTISWGAPTEAEDQAYDMVYMGGTNVPEDSYVTLGASMTAEIYRVSLIVDVYRYGDDEQATEERAWQLLNGVVTVLDQDKTLGGNVVLIAGFRFRQSNPVPSPSYWHSQILIEVSVEARVSP